MKKQFIEIQEQYTSIAAELNRMKEERKREEERKKEEELKQLKQKAEELRILKKEAAKIQAENNALTLKADIFDRVGGIVSGMGGMGLSSRGWGWGGGWGGVAAIQGPR